MPWHNTACHNIAWCKRRLCGLTGVSAPPRGRRPVWPSHVQIPMNQVRTQTLRQCHSPPCVAVHSCVILHHLTLRSRQHHGSALLSIICIIITLRHHSVLRAALNRRRTLFCCAVPKRRLDQQPHRPPRRHNGRGSADRRLA